MVIYQGSGNNSILKTFEFEETIALFIQKSISIDFVISVTKQFLEEGITAVVSFPGVRKEGRIVE